MPTLLLLVTDLELMTAQIVKSILLVLILAGISLVLYKVAKSNRNQKRYWRLLFVPLLVIFINPLIESLRRDNAMLKSAQYVIGKTTGVCHVFARGKGVSFEYKIQGKVYENCNTFHPIKLEDIVVSGGKYNVRYAPQYPDQGRIDFSRRME